VLLPDYVPLHACDHCRSRVIVLCFLKPTLRQYWRPAHFVVISRFFYLLFLPHFKSGPHRFFEITRQISLVNIDDLFNYFVKLIHTSSKCQDLSRYDPRLSGLKSGPDPTNNENDHTNNQHQLIAAQFYKQLYIN